VVPVRRADESDFSSGGLPGAGLRIKEKDHAIHDDSEGDPGQREGPDATENLISEMQKYHEELQKRVFYSMRAA